MLSPRKKGTIRKNASLTRIPYTVLLQNRGNLGEFREIPPLEKGMPVFFLPQTRFIEIRMLECEYEHRSFRIEYEYNLSGP